MIHLKNKTLKKNGSEIKNVSFCTPVHIIQTADCCVHYILLTKIKHFQLHMLLKCCIFICFMQDDE